MIQLTNKTTVSLLLLALRQNYNKSWFTTNTEREGWIAVGVHAPSGEIGYYIPEEYLEYLNGMIELDKLDLVATSFETDASSRIFEWVKQV